MSVPRTRNSYTDSAPVGRVYSDRVCHLDMSRAEKIHTLLKLG
jgi:hypothetical protein